MISKRRPFRATLMWLLPPPLLAALLSLAGNSAPIVETIAQSIPCVTATSDVQIAPTFATGNESGVQSTSTPTLTSTPCVALNPPTPTPTPIRLSAQSASGPYTVGSFNGTTGQFTLKYFTNAGGGSFTQGLVIQFIYGAPPSGTPSGLIPLVHDLEPGAGTTYNQKSVGLYNPNNGAFILRCTNSGGLPDYTFLYGPGTPGDIVPLMGDWNGDGADTQGIYVRSTSVFILSDRLNGAPNYGFPYGSPNQGLIPVVGDWDSDGRDTVGLFNPANSYWLLINQNASVAPEVVIQFNPLLPNTPTPSATPTSTRTRVPTRTPASTLPPTPVVPITGAFGEGDPRLSIFSLLTNIYYTQYSANALGPYTPTTIQFGSGAGTPIAGEWMSGTGYGLDLYGVTVQGTFSAGEVNSIFEGVRKTAQALHLQFPGSYCPSDTFRRVMYAGSPFQSIQFIKSTGTVDGSNTACSTNYNVNPLTIMCPSGNVMTEYTAAHELGHAFIARMGKNRGFSQAPNYYTYWGLLEKPPVTNINPTPQLQIFDYEGRSLFGEINSDWQRGPNGWGSASAPGLCIFQQNPLNVPSTGTIQEKIKEIDEAAADMFLNWVYSKVGGGGFRNIDWANVQSCDTGTSNDTARPGDKRLDWMNTVAMPILAPSIIAPTFIPFTPTYTLTPTYTRTRSCGIDC